MRWVRNICKWFSILSIVNKQYIKRKKSNYYIKVYTNYIANDVFCFWFWGKITFLVLCCVFCFLLIARLDPLPFTLRYLMGMQRSFVFFWTEEPTSRLMIGWVNNYCFGVHSYMYFYINTVCIWWVHMARDRYLYKYTSTLIVYLLYIYIYI